mmetsp:Transcript_15351/g.25593  ORF Transcript_15351/g.25593 Transcript_15351/m.25593 type:complete len:349 (+) Transcript_15351:80-1126(+)
MTTNFLKKAFDPLGLTVDDDAGQIFVTSGTGVVGFRVAMGLLDAGYKHVRVGIWKGKRQIGVDNSIGQKVLDVLEEKGATVIAYDWTNEEDYQMALAGVNTVFCTIPHMHASLDIFTKFLAACKKLGVEHFVKTSFYEMPGDPYSKTVPFVQFQRQCDELITKNTLTTRMTYTVLGASHQMSSPLIHQGPVFRDEDETANRYVTASYAMGVNYISPNDIAKAAIVTIVNRKKHRNKTYNLSGPGPITDKEVCKHLSKFYDKKIRHVPVGYNDIVEDLQKRGFEKWLGKDLAEFEKVKASGVEEYSSAYPKDFELLAGRKPETFDVYLANKGSMTLQENPDSAPTHVEL